MNTYFPQQMSKMEATCTVLRLILKYLPIVLEGVGQQSKNSRVQIGQKMWDCCIVSICHDVMVVQI